jgi:hypothetical protein
MAQNLCPVRSQGNAHNGHRLDAPPEGFGRPFMCASAESVPCALSEPATPGI